MFGIVSDSMISKNGRWKHFRKYVAFDSVSNMQHIANRVKGYSL